MRPQCPSCQSIYVRRAHRIGILERAISLFYVYPFRCQLCSTRFSNFQWGVRYDKQEDLRQYERIGVRFPVLFTSARTTGKGMITDISVADCAVESQVALKVGDTLKLELYAKAGRTPIVIEKAVVRSIRKSTAGIQFTDVSEADQARLNRLVSDMVGVPIAPIRAASAPVH